MRAPRRNRILGSLALLAAVSAPLAWSADAEDDDERLQAFAGHYDVIGRRPDSKTTYAGTMDVSVARGRLVLRRSIGGRASPGLAKLEHRTADKIEILTVELPGEGPLEAWCAIGSDLDNGPRVTCEVRRKGREAKSVGLEAWFFRGS